MFVISLHYFTIVKMTYVKCRLLSIVGRCRRSAAFFLIGQLRPLQTVQRALEMAMLFPISLVFILSILEQVLVSIADVKTVTFEP